MLYAPTVPAAALRSEGAFVFQKTFVPAGGDEPAPASPQPGGGGAPVPPPPSPGPLPPQFWLGVVAVIAGAVVCLCLSGFLFWKLYGSGSTSAATPTSVPTALADEPTAVVTNTPSPQIYLNALPAQHGVTGRQLILMGLPGADLLTLAQFFTEDNALDEIYSISSVEAGIYKPWVDLRWHIAATLGSAPGAENSIFNRSLYECGQQNERTVVCSQDVMPMPPGDIVMASMEMAEPLPAPSAELGPDQPQTIPIGDTMLVYAFVVDSDGDPEGNFVAQSPYDWDFYQGTDTWYELVGDPEYGVWVLYVTDATRTPLNSSARAVIEGNTVTFYIAADELGDPSQVGYRMSAFQTDGSYAPEVSTGDVTGANPEEALMPLVDTGLTLLGPPVPMPNLELPASPAATATAEPSGSGAADVEAQARTFIGAFSAAQEAHDVDFLFDHLGQETLDRYGEAQCRKYLAGVAGTATSFEVLSTSYPEPFTYAADGQTTTIPDTVVVEVQYQALGTPTTGSLHILVEDGQTYWFTDCGTPISG
jgi:hypothetical protein